MTVFVLTACPDSLRGHLTRWFLEISAGVFVGHVSARIRDRLWELVRSLAGAGRALMVFQARNEQRLSFRVHSHHWKPVDVDGLTLMQRPTVEKKPAPPPGWSKAAKRRKYGSRKKTKGREDRPTNESE